MAKINGAQNKNGNLEREGDRARGIESRQFPATMAFVLRKVQRCPCEPVSDVWNVLSRADNWYCRRIHPLNLSRPIFPLAARTFSRVALSATSYLFSRHITEPHLHRVRYAVARFRDRTPLPKCFTENDKM
jgi:hypothetical protein